MQLLSVSIKNYRAFQDVVLNAGSSSKPSLPKLCVLVGPNGVGKSTFFDVFSFLQDALETNVANALEMRSRGGFDEVRTRGSTGPICIKLQYKPDEHHPTVTYLLEVDRNARQQVIVSKEQLKFRRVASESAGTAYNFIHFKTGRGDAIENEYEFSTNADQTEDRKKHVLKSPDLLAIKALGYTEKFPAVSKLREVIESWYISDLHIDNARPSQEIGIAEHLNRKGDNLALVASHLFQHHPEVFKQILETMKRRVPGISRVEPKRTDDGRLVLRFHDGSFKDPFLARHVSDGTLRMFAYLVLLHDPKPHPLLAIEEPENQLYPHLLGELAEEFRSYAHRNRGQGQAFVSTHSPDLLNAIETEELFVIQKVDGISQIHSAAKDRQVMDFYKAGDKLGYLWHQKLLTGVGLS